MPTKAETKANKAEIRKLLRELKSNDRAKAKIIRQQRAIIKKADKAIQLAELRTGLYAKKIMRRIHILDGRNQN